MFSRKSISFITYFPRKIYRSANYKNEKDAIHLFLLSPRLSGSTVIKQLISTSPNVTSFRTEGQWLPEARPLIGVNNRWDPDLPVNWAKVKDVFYSYWSPFKWVRFEKSPPHIVRAAQIAKEFPNCYFIITIRDPYAQVEGELRRGWMASPEAAAEFWVTAAKTQLYNLGVLERTLFFTYEQLTGNTAEVIQKMINFLPALRSFTPEKKFKARNITGRPIRGIRNLNQLKIDKLQQPDIDRINDVLSKHKETLNAFGYEIKSQGRLDN